MDNNRVNIIIDEKGTEFLAEIRKAVDYKPYVKSIRIVDADFPLLMPRYDYFYEYRSLMWKIEWAIRDYLVTGIIHDLLDEYNIPNQLYSEDAFLAHPSFRYERKSFSDRYNYVFIIGDKKRTGIRYDYFNMDDDEIERIHSLNRIDETYVLDFQRQLDRDEEYNVQKRTNRISLKRFFDIFIDPEVYDVYLSKTRDYIAEACDELGFKAIANLTYKNSLRLKLNTLNILSTLAFSQNVYQFHDSNQTPLDLTEEQHKLLTNRFLNERRYYALCGNSDFAKCFITSEYLYRVFKENYPDGTDDKDKRDYDYTAIVSGYLKSVEQLLYQLYISTAENDKLLEYRTKRKKKAPLDELINLDNPSEKVYVYSRTIKDVEKHKPEMGGLLLFLRYHKDIWEIDEDGKEVIAKILNDYKQYCRNEHFHKDNIDSFSEVKKIKANTILCLYYILGGFSFTSKNNNEKLLLGIHDFSFERLYYALREFPRSDCFYIFEMPNNEQINAVRLLDQETPRFDKVLTSSVYFLNVDDFSGFKWEDNYDYLSDKRLFTLSRDNVPLKAWWINRLTKEKNEIKW